jgi:hypothetical protein
MPMQIKTIFAVIALTLAPGFAIAQGCSEEHANMSCAEGKTFDAETNSCVPVSS